jgi:hypothetical protein
MSLVQLVLASLLTLPVWSGDRNEDTEARQARFMSVATAEVDAAERATCSGEYNGVECKPIWKGSIKEIIAATESVGYWESNYSKAVGEQHCLGVPGGCDHNRARGYWQCWITACPELWKTDSNSPEEVKVAAWESMKLLIGFRKTCDSWDKAFTAYTGRGCKVSATGVARRTTMLSIMRKL